MSLAILEIFAMVILQEFHSKLFVSLKTILQDTTKPVSCCVCQLLVNETRALEKLWYHFLIQLLGGGDVGGFVGISTKLKPFGRKLH